MSSKANDRRKWRRENEPGYRERIIEQARAYRERTRTARIERYHNDEEYRKKHDAATSAYQKRMWATSEEFRARKKELKKTNPYGKQIGRPKKY